MKSIVLSSKSHAELSARCSRAVMDYYDCGAGGVIRCKASSDNDVCRCSELGIIFVDVVRQYCEFRFREIEIEEVE